jgi:ABC-type antimicrobial peptide transport system ATPase subunit
MKITLIIWLLWALTVPKPIVRSVSLTMQTRGVRKEIRVDARQMHVTLNDRVVTRPTSARHWQQLTALLNRMNLATLPTLPVSTHRQATDAALAAQLVVVTAGKTYESAAYDHPNPPPAMHPLVTALIDGVPAGMRAEFR